MTDLNNPPPLAAEQRAALERSVALPYAPIDKSDISPLMRSSGQMRRA